MSESFESAMPLFATAWAVLNQTSRVEESEKMPFVLTIMSEALLTPCRNVQFHTIITIVNHTRYNVLLYVYNHVIIADMHTIALVNCELLKIDI